MVICAISDIKQVVQPKFLIKYIHFDRILGQIVSTDLGRCLSWYPFIFPNSGYCSKA